MIDAAAQVHTAGQAKSAADGCEWWNLVCQGGQQAADSGLSAITNSMVNGLIALFGQITKVVDESTRVPLADPTYRDTYYGFAALAVPVILVVFFLAALSSAIHHDARALTRAAVGIGVAGIGGAVYVLFAQFLVALDDWLAHGVVSVTGADFGAQMADLTKKFESMGADGSLAANALMLILMVLALLAGVFLWAVLLLRKMAILVVVAFAPLLIAGWLWAPTRSWSRKATEVLVALVFSKTVIYMIFGIGMSLLIRSNQSLSDFVGVIVLLCGACFAPLVMLRLVHFAADSHIAGDMVGTLKAGAQPTISKLTTSGGSGGPQRQRMASDYASIAKRSQATTAGGGKAAAAGGSSAGAAAGSAGTAGAAAAGPVGIAAMAGAAKVKSTAGSVRRAGGTAARSAERMADSSTSQPPSVSGPSPDKE